MSNAWEIPGGQFSLDVADSVKPVDSNKPAGLDNPCMVAHRFIQVNEDGCAEYASATADPVVGVSYTEAPAGAPISIVGCGIVMVECSAAITAGAFVGVGADGKAAAGTATANVGIALSTSNPASLVSVLLK